MILQKLNELIPIHSDVQALHPALAKLYPIAIADHKDNTLAMYDVDPSGNYSFIMKETFQVPLPERIRASFPIEWYDSRCCCVVSEDIFDEAEGFVMIFHEFVHCYQYEHGEGDIKNSLSISKKYDDPSWELNHPFPYGEDLFESAFPKIVHPARQGLSSALRSSFEMLRAGLQKYDYEYMIWQIWKEGFARYIENRIREKYGLKINTLGNDTPYGRVSFYYLGDLLISYLERKDSRKLNNLRELFDILYTHAF